MDCLCGVPDISDEQVEESPVLQDRLKVDCGSAIFNPKPLSKGKAAKVRCCVPGCKSRIDRSRELSFHLWPKAGARWVKISNSLGVDAIVDCQYMWMKRLKMGKRCTSAMRVCSLHFTKQDYVYSGENTKKHVLKKDAVPTICLPPTPVHGTVSTRPMKTAVGLSTNRTQRYQRGLSFQRSNELKNTPQNSKNLELERSHDGDGYVVINERTDVQPTNKDGFISSKAQSSEDKAVATKRLLNSRLSKQEIGIQVNSADILTPFISIVKSDSILNTLTGIPSLKILDGITKIMQRVCSKCADNRFNLTMKERIVLTMLKIKQDLSYVMLAALFQKISRQSCKRIFEHTVLLLAKVLSPLLRWLTREEIDKNMPLCFQKYSNTRIVLDCTEIAIEKPKCLRCRVRCYSQYKSTFTLKWLTGVTPAGVTSYVSPSYGGRASDKHIFLNSGLLNKMIGGIDAIMVDKGFLIETECATHNIKLIRPPFLRGEKQFSKEQALLNKDIAAARVHIERVNQRIKMYKILKNRFPWALVGYADHIFNIVCALVNLSSPILSDDKF